MDCGAWVWSSRGVQQCKACGKSFKANDKGAGGEGTERAQQEAGDQPGGGGESWHNNHCKAPAGLEGSSPQALADLLAKALQIDVVKLLGDALPAEQPKEEKPKPAGEGQLYHDMSAARSRYNRSAAVVTKKGKEVEKLKQQLKEAEEQLEQATTEKTEADANFGEVSEKYFTSARGVVVVEGEQGNPLDHEDAPEGEHQEDLDEEMLQVGELNEQEEAAKQELLSKLARQEAAATKRVEDTKRRRTALQSNLNKAKARKTLEEGDAAAERAKAIKLEGTSAADLAAQSG